MGNSISNPAVPLHEWTSSEIVSLLQPNKKQLPVSFYKNDNEIFKGLETVINDDGINGEYLLRIKDDKDFQQTFYHRLQEEVGCDEVKFKKLLFLWQDFKKAAVIDANRTVTPSPTFDNSRPSSSRVAVAQTNNSRPSSSRVAVAQTNNSRPSSSRVAVAQTNNSRTPNYLFLKRGEINVCWALTVANKRFPNHDEHMKKRFAMLVLHYSRKNCSKKIFPSVLERYYSVEFYQEKTRVYKDYDNTDFNKYTALLEAMKEVADSYPDDELLDAAKAYSLYGEMAAGIPSGKNGGMYVSLAKIRELAKRGI